MLDCLKITDFGLSTFYISGGKDVLLKSNVGTPLFVAPEVIGEICYRFDTLILMMK